VQLQYSYYDNSCIDGGKPFKFKYIFNGKVSYTVQYLTWKMDYINCNGDLFFEQRSIQIGGSEIVKAYGSYELKDITVYDQLNTKFVCSSLETLFYDVTVSATEKVSSGYKTPAKSIEPAAIDGIRNILIGETTTLTVKGGLLGSGANWVWYEGNCGSVNVGSGKSITIKPTESKMYFVRAEGRNNITACAEILVNVDLRSTPATGIVGDSNICVGESALLSIEGGTLGIGANWVWYSSDGFDKRIGTGSSINVSPIEAKSYFVRAEGQYNKTDFKRIRVNVLEKSIEPTSINASGTTTICEGEKVYLVVNGGDLSNDADWEWYSGSCGSYFSIASGSSIAVTPTVTTTYFVRGEGLCFITNCVSITITVRKASIIPWDIAAPQEVYKRKDAVLTLNGGSLGYEADWQWYKESCDNGKLVGNGSTLSIRTGKSRTYFVKAVGLCNVTECASILVDPIRRSPEGGFNNNGHLGLGVGLEYLHFKEPGQYLENSNGHLTALDSFYIAVGGTGLNLELVYFPILNDHVSLGFMPSYAIGGAFGSATESDNYYTESTVDYLYQRFQMESELTLGLEAVKILVRYHLSSQLNDFTKVESPGYFDDSSTYTYNENINRESVFFGLRIGRYQSRKSYRPGNMFDILYSLSIVRPDDIFKYAKDLSLSSWKVGAGLSWWSQSDLKFQFDVVFNQTQKDFSFTGDNFENALYRVSIVFNNR